MRSEIRRLVCLCVVGFYCLLFGFTAMAADSSSDLKYGGIEIGGKGVKVTLVEIQTKDGKSSLRFKDVGKPKNFNISQLKDNKFQSALIGDVADAVEAFKQTLINDNGVSLTNIQAVLSSGVPIASNYTDLLDAIHEKTQLDVQKISATEE